MKDLGIVLIFRGMILVIMPGVGEISQGKIRWQTLVLVNEFHVICFPSYHNFSIF